MFLFSPIGAFDVMGGGPRKRADGSPHRLPNGISLTLEGDVLTRPDRPVEDDGKLEPTAERPEL